MCARAHRHDIQYCIATSELEETMSGKWTSLMISGVVALGASTAVPAQDFIRAEDAYTYRIARAPDWDPAADEGRCRLRVFVDDRARINLRGDQIIVETRSGRRSFDQGSHCTQPLPYHRVDDFRVTSERGRGSVANVRIPNRRNDYTGSIVIDDPQSGGDTYVIEVAWRNPEDRPAVAAAPVASPYFDETRACQDRVRRDFLARNPDDAYIEFTGVPVREEVGPNRERIIGDGWARNRAESRPMTYECLLNERNDRVLASSYEMRGRRYSALR